MSKKFYPLREILDFGHVLRSENAETSDCNGLEHAIIAFSSGILPRLFWKLKKSKFRQVKENRF